MIRFQDMAERSQNADLSSSASFKEIKPENRLTTEGAQKFWDTAFDGNPDHQDVVELDEEHIFAEIFGRSEDEFTFDFETSDELKSALEQFEPDNWDRLSKVDRETAVDAFCAELSKDLELDNTPKIQYFDGPPGHAGFYDLDNHSINLNSGLLANPKELINTAAHELRHAYQHQRAELLETWNDMLYKVNFDNYISPVQLADGKYLFFTDYQDQFVEVEARAFANLFSGEGASR